MHISCPMKAAQPLIPGCTCSPTSPQVSQLAGHLRRVPGFVWLKGIRELDGAGVMRAADLLACTGIEVIRSLDGTLAESAARVRLSEWTRPVLLDGSAVLLVEQPEDDDVEHDWRIVAREVICGY